MLYMLKSSHQYFAFGPYICTGTPPTSLPQPLVLPPYFWISAPTSRSPPLLLDLRPYFQYYPPTSGSPPLLLVLRPSSSWLLFKLGRGNQRTQFQGISRPGRNQLFNPLETLNSAGDKKVLVYYGTVRVIYKPG